jgi:hypothetical protein
MAHGAFVRLDALEAVGDVLASRQPELAEAARPRAMDLQAFDFLFPQLQDDPANLLLESAQTPPDLVALGQTMGEPPPGGAGDPGDADIPAAYTYFGQFLDHDITLDAGSAPLANLMSPGLMPLPRDSIPENIRNVRTGTLDLDSVYGQGPTSDPNPVVPYDGDKLKLGKVTGLNGQVRPTLRPPGKDDDNDLPREPRGSDPAHDRAARIGDPRNDENTIVAQLHLAFLRAHNALVDDGDNFKKAQRLLRQHYQHIVVHDFLKRIADPAIVNDIVDNGNQVFDPTGRDFFMPVEFSFAAYRFGHSMARAAYNFNLNFNHSGQPGTFPASFELLFTFTALTGQLGFGQGTDTLPDNWIAEWENLIDDGQPFDKARRIDTQLAPALFGLRDEVGTPLAGLHSHLAVRNLLRGYLVRMPTGQAVAQALGITPLTPAQIQAAAGSPSQVTVLQSGGFLSRTPLWYYVLAEAAHGGGQPLGPVGSTILAEVLIGLVRRSPDSILKGNKQWKPSLPSSSPGAFELADLLRLAGSMP